MNKFLLIGLAALILIPNAYTVYKDAYGHFTARRETEVVVINASESTTGKVTVSVPGSDISFSSLATGDFFAVKVPRKPQTTSWNNAISGILEDGSKVQGNVVRGESVQDGYARIVYTILKGGKVWAAPTGDLVTVEVDRATLHLDIKPTKSE